MRNQHRLQVFAPFPNTVLSCVAPALHAAGPNCTLHLAICPQLSGHLARDKLTFLNSSNVPQSCENAFILHRPYSKAYGRKLNSPAIVIPIRGRKSKFSPSRACMPACWIAPCCMRLIWDCPTSCTAVPVCCMHAADRYGRARSV